MAATMNNMELTRSVEVLQHQVVDLNNRLTAAVPEMNSNISQSAEAVMAMYLAIKSDIQPVIDQFGPLSTLLGDMNTEATAEKVKLTKLEDDVKAEVVKLTKDLEEKTKNMEASMTTLRDLMNQASQKFGVDAQSKIEFEVKQDQISAKMDAILLEVDHMKRTEQDHYQSTQMQMTTAMSTASFGSSPGPSRGSEPLVTHKLMMNET